MPSWSSCSPTKASAPWSRDNEPMNAKTHRQRLIADWLREFRVGSQEELVARLSLAGVAATQATVSRDLLELGAAKLDRLLAEWVDGIIPAGNLLVLKTPPGSANLVANALDSAGLEEIAGTLAGDDTIFLALTEGTNPHSVALMLQRRRSGA